MRGRKPHPRKSGKRNAPPAPDALPRCPPHLTGAARNEWRRLARTLYEMGILTVADRAALAAYCQSWARWVEAEEQLKQTPPLIRTPSGYVQQSPWLSIANKQLELMGRYMAELGITPSARNRVALRDAPNDAAGHHILRVIFDAEDGTCRDIDGNLVDAAEVRAALPDRR